MRYCEKCKIHIKGDHDQCPLCQCELSVREHEVEQVFPIVSARADRYQLVVKVVTFLVLVVSVISLVFDIILPVEGWWSLVIIATLGSIWLSVVTAIFKHKNILKYLLYQSVIISLFAVFIDYRIGWYGWSIAYVLPILLTVLMVVMYVLSKVLKLETGDYMIYLLLDGLFGIIPIIFIRLGTLQSEIPSYICIIASIVSIIALIVFEGRNMYGELKRRLHV